MKSKRRHIDPEQLTSEERLDRIVEILVRAGLKLYWEAPLRSLRELRRVKKRGGEESIASSLPKETFASEGLARS